MHRCQCSTKALESFVKDFAGISLRQQRAQRFFQHYRSFGTKPPSQHVQTTANTHADDSFNPFDNTALKSSRQNLRRRKEDEDVVQQKEQASAGLQEHGVEGGKEETWHAEIEVKNQGSGGRGSAHRTIDPVSIRASHGADLPHEISETNGAVLDLPAISQHILAPSSVLNKDAGPLSTPGLSPRMPKRLERKLRRIEQGKHPVARPVQNEEGEEYDESVSNVLGKIDALEGPSIKKKAKEEPKKNVESVKSKVQDKSKDDSTKKRKTEEIKSKSPINTKAKPDKILSKERWMMEKDVLKRKFGEKGWQPRKRLSPDTLEGIRALHASDPGTYSTEMLASHFQITPENIRRILKSKWQPSADEAAKRMQRWERRGLKKWEEMAAKGMKPPQKWREMGAGNPNVERKEKNAVKPQTSWEAAVDAAGRLPMEGSLADRIL